MGNQIMKTPTQTRAQKNKEQKILYQYAFRRNDHQKRDYEQLQE